ncbi:Multisubunit Na+/H+ antiporter, MnhB subunit [Thiohalospira halophila DSM 15071]|uniref:Multisubunit Na+/H+ antiporter, MnhB subunit n=1 Tax=Thiohalospira halophila DSM 15071 TaxID=1123397 RepID=A0A1I1N9A5_9GAMM|nr:hydrogenase subunit MbhD domain-containing protein [Thiohalospira halophila]SFC93946.1 Multisubunit Na+/H+ antiporter, MnhB subunit [Thiohalospira halophila DSM 15071]
MAALTAALDGLLALALAGVAVAALGGKRRFRSVILFVVFGLFLALAWARLGAVDLALAEAAIGAGVTGALLMAALDRLRRTEVGAEPPPRPRLWPAVVVSLPVAAAGTWTLLSMEPAVRPPVAAHLEASGVDHPVTAVLLAFRAWDTLLEVAVLVAAGLAVRAAGPVPRPPTTEAGPLQRGLLRLVVPVMVVLAVYLLWRGSHAPGGAFQAGALLAAAGVLIQLTHFPGPLDRTRAWQRPAGMVGLAVFTAAALGTLALTAPLAWPAAWAKVWILTIEAAAALSIGVLLTRLFTGGAPVAASGEERS